MTARASMERVGSFQTSGCPAGVNMFLEHFTWAVHWTVWCEPLVLCCVRSLASAIVPAAS